MREREYTVLKRNSEFDEDIELRQFTGENPNVISLFDGDEIVSIDLGKDVYEVSVLQSESMAWFFDGYVKAKRSETLK